MPIRIGCLEKKKKAIDVMVKSIVRDLMEM